MEIFILVVIVLIALRFLYWGYMAFATFQVIKSVWNEQVNYNAQLEETMRQMDLAYRAQQMAEINRLRQVFQQQTTAVPKPEARNYTQRMNDVAAGKKHFNPATGEWED